jgi:peptidyl-prolyl cis-trans isomerase D
MLQTLRSRAAGTVAKILFIVLVLSFAVWGIGDYAFLQRGDPTAVSVGGTKVTATELGNEYRRDLDRLRQQFGDIDNETARQFGLMDRVIDRLAAQALFQQASGELGLRVGDDLVRMALYNNPALQGPGGIFDPTAFRDLLSRMGYTEDRYSALVRNEIARTLVTNSLSAGIEVPEAVVDRLFRYRNERRTGEIVFVPSASFADVGQSDAEALQVIYDDNQERFTLPEYRDLTVVRIGADEMVPKIEVTDEELADEYQQRLPSLRVAEKREVEQILVPSEDQVKSAAEKIAAGGDFLDVAKEVASQSPETTKLGVVEKTSLPGVGDAVFALEEGKVSEPVRGPFGWHLFRVTRIEPGHEPTLDEVRDALRPEIAQRVAYDAAVKASNQLEDALGARASLEDAAKLVDVPAVKVTEVGPTGTTSSGGAVPIIANAPDVLNAAFELQEGRDTPVIEARAGGFYVVRVDRVVASRVKSLDEVRSEVEDIWRGQKRDEAAKARADKILEEVRGGKKLEEAAAAFDLKPEMTAPMRRAIDGPLPPNMTADLVGQLFRLKAGEAGTAGGRQGYFVVRLAEVTPADPASDAAGVNNLRTTLRQQMAVDLSTSMADALRRRFGVTIDQEVVRTVQ